MFPSLSRVFQRLLRSRPAAWVLPGVIAVTLALLQLAGNGAASVLRYDRERILQGNAWRLLTGHLVHADFPHLAWNLFGIVLVWALFAGEFTAGSWIAVMLASTAAIDLGFLAFEPGLEWYVGFSGVLHGLMAAGLVAWLRERRDPLIVVVAVLFVGKLVWEHVRGPLPFTAGTLAVAVVHEAHTYGAIGGALCAAWLLARRSHARPSL